MRALIEAPDDPIGRQFIPDFSELVTAAHESVDPIGDDALSPVKGVVHRYPDRALLKPLLICPVYCRFCFRREHVGPDGGVLTDAELEAALGWFAAHPEVTEVILTGGDPLMLSARRLRMIVGTLSAMPHVQTIRIHSRVPVADPERLTDELAGAMETDRSMWLVIHANHAREFTPAADAALRRVRALGIPILGQSVLLRDVNDSSAALEALFRAMISASGEAVLSAPVGCGAGDRSVSRPDRGGTRTAGGIAGTGNGVGLAHLRAGYSRGVWKSPGRAGLPASRWFGAGCSG